MLLLASFVRRRVWSAPVGAAVLAAFAAAGPSVVLAAQTVPSAPSRPAFAMGDVLGHRVNVSRAGNVGQGQMCVERPVLKRGTLTWRLVFVMQAQRGPIKAIDRTPRGSTRPRLRPRDSKRPRSIRCRATTRPLESTRPQALGRGTPGRGKRWRRPCHWTSSRSCTSGAASRWSRSARSRFRSTSTRRAIRRSCTCAVKN